MRRVTIVAVHTLGFAILGLLARQPLSGYDIALKLRRPIGFYWTARHSQIYPELRRLSREGLVTSGKPEAGRRRRAYTITRSGRTELRRWLSKPPARPEPRDEVMLKTYSIWMARPESALAFYRQLQGAHSLRLSEYKAMLETLELDTGKPRAGLDEPDFGNYATLVLGIGYEQAYLDWCRWLIDQLKGRRSLPASKRSSQRGKKASKH
jgi:DNA-binding PadR family transcriptional regulator